MKAPAHPDNIERLKELEDFGVLDSLPEQAFDDLVELASRLTGSPVSLVSLVDQDRQWFKASKGFGPAETGLEDSICAHAILEGGLVEINDTFADRRTANMPIVIQDLDPVRFYAGTPLVSPDGFPLGMFCVLDHVPRQLTEEQRFALKVLGDQVMAQLNLRRQIKQQELIRVELEKSLVERDLLAQEIDHRTKNSLAMVSAFLNLQQRRAVSDETKAELGAAALRVAAIGQLHEELYSAADNGVVDLAQFAARLTTLIGRNAPKGIIFELELAPVSIDAKRASAFAVVTNEFIANAFKYAFPGKEEGAVRLEGSIEGETYHLTMSDNGVGDLMASNQDESQTGLGTKIIEAVGRQLGGMPELTAGPEGYSLSISFPIEQVLAETV